MQKSQIKPSTEYAFREKRLPGTPFEHVKILEYIRGNKWKAEWIEPNPGLVHYVESGQLICTWKERRAFLKEEEERERFRKRNEELGYSEDSPLANALYEVFASVGDREIDFYKGDLSSAPEAIDRIRVRAGGESGTTSPYGYLDRQGKLHIPFEEALELARRFCAREPGTVLASVEATERKWAEEARRPGEEYRISLLNEYRATWALIRQWTGHDPAIQAREEYIQKLERLVWDAIYALQQAHLDSEAGRLRRALERH